MGYLNTQLEKVASAAKGGMEKSSKFLPALGKFGRGVVNHIGKHKGKYLLGGGLAGWGAYNYLNTGKIDPETGLPVLPRDRAYIQDTFGIDGEDGMHQALFNTISADDPDAEEQRLYANAFEDYKKKRRYYEDMPWWQKILPFPVGEAKRINQEFYRHSGKFMPRQIYTRGLQSSTYYRERQPYHAGVNVDIARMSPEERAALDDPKVAAAVQASIDTQRPFARLNSPWIYRNGFDQKNTELRPKYQRYYENAFPRVWSPDDNRSYPNPNYNPEFYGLKR